VSKDFIYALIVEEYGLFLGGIGVIFLCLWLLWRGGVLIRKVDTVFQAVVITGSVTLIVFQAFVHIAVNVGLLPVTGQTLPLISKGGTSIMVMGMLFGLILGMSRKVEEKNENLSATAKTKDIEETDESKSHTETEPNITTPQETIPDATTVDSTIDDNSIDSLFVQIDKDKE